MMKIEAISEGKNRREQLACSFPQASKETINALISIGALYVDETGIHSSDPGIYPKNKLSLSTAKSKQG